MANNKMIVAERSRDIGNFLVGRLLPFRKKRQVGPFTFIDHMGPSEVGPDKYMDVDQHPHIGLSTLTYLLEGEMEHKDSTGAFRIVTPGSVNFMTAGKGVTHTERTPQHQRDGGTYLIHGYQVWIALPKELEEMEPSFVHFDKIDLPSWLEGDAIYTLVAGEGFGRKSPVPVYSPLFMMDIVVNKAHQLNVNGQLKGEIAVVVVKGSVKDGDHCIEQGQMLISKTDDQCAVQIEPNSRILLFGGQPFPEERLMHWNFVSSSKALMEKAKADWRNKRFPKVPGDDTYIPLP
ncbi:MAG: pirin family protein [Bacteroidota bacterium]